MNLVQSTFTQIFIEVFHIKIFIAKKIKTDYLIRRKVRGSLWLFYDGIIFKNILFEILCLIQNNKVPFTRNPIKLLIRIQF